MNALESEELDRELVERSAKSQFFGEVVTIKVGKKTLSFISEYGSRITFERRTNGLHITTQKSIRETERCSMGHEHETGRTLKEFGFFAIDFEMIEQLKDWSEQGVWIAPNRKKDRA